MKKYRVSFETYWSTGRTAGNLLGNSNETKSDFYDCVVESERDAIQGTLFYISQYNDLALFRGFGRMVITPE